MKLTLVSMNLHCFKHLLAYIMQSVKIRTQKQQKVVSKFFIRIKMAENDKKCPK